MPHVDRDFPLPGLATSPPPFHPAWWEGVPVALHSGDACQAGGRNAQYPLDRSGTGFRSFWPADRKSKIIRGSRAFVTNHREEEETRPRDP